MAQESEDMADFKMKYDGPALQTGLMPVRDLAPALIALSELFHEARALDAPTAPPVNLEVRATNGGSFEIALHVATSEVVTLLNDPNATAVANLIAYIGGAAGLFALIRKLRNRRVVNREQDELGQTTFILDNEVTIIVPAIVANLYDRPTARKYAREVVSPLRRDGVDSLRFEIRDETTVEVAAEEEEAFEAADESAPIIDQTLDAVVSVISPAFTPKYKWRLAMGDQIIMATVQDERFLEQIERHEAAFLEGDALYCRVRMRQWGPEVGKPIEWTVLEVRRHEHTAGQETRLPFADKPEDET